VILEHRQLQKLKSTYVDALQVLVNPDTGRVHTTFNQTGAATGRLSSSDPNLQNIPIRTEEGKRVRRAFAARPGEMLLSADYSQIELRVLAHMTSDPKLFDAFAAGEDPHAATAAEVLDLSIEQVTSDDRRVAKMVNYGVLYGMSDFGLADRLGLPPDRAAGFIERYFERFNTVRQFQENVVSEAIREGYAKTILGRRRYFPEMRSPIYAVRQAAIRQALNAPIQGSASDIVKVAMIQVAAYLERKAPSVRMLLQVHDELLLEGPEDELKRIAPVLGELMIHAVELNVPLHVDFKLGPNWQDMHTLLVADEAVASGQLSVVSSS
jgi:DNA polymerase-1